MKKFVLLAMTALLVFGIAGSAFAAHLEVMGNGASLTVNGEAIVRGVYHDWDNDQNFREWDQRFRLILNAGVTEGVNVITRFTTSNGNWDGLSETGGGGAVSTDWAYLKMNMFGGTYFIGRQPVSWGNKFDTWAATADRLKAVYKMGDSTVGALLQKQGETSNGAPMTDGVEGDYDIYAAFYIAKLADAKVGVIGVYYTQDGGDNGHKVDVFFNVNAGPAKIAGEVSYKGGDLMTNADDSAKMGAFVAATFDLDAASVTAAAAYAANGYVADDDFQPTLFFGTGYGNPNAIANFGATADSTNDDFSAAVLVNAQFAAGEGMTAGVTGAYAILSDEGEGTIIELDAYLNYALAKNTSWKLGVAYGITDKFNGDDAIMTVAHKLTVTF